MYLGWSEGFHDAAASVIDENGNIVFASHSERFSGNKHEKYVSSELKEYINNNFDIKVNSFFEKPFLKFERLLETYLTETPRGFKSFLMAIPVWLKEKLFLKDTLIKEFANLQAELDSNINKEDKKQFKTLKEKINFYF